MIKDIFKDTVFVGLVVAGRTTNEIFESWELESSHRPRFGRNWWFWLPSINTNGGWFRPTLNTTFNFNWLCFCLWVDVFAWKKPKKYDKKLYKHYFY